MSKFQFHTVSQNCAKHIVPLTNKQEIQSICRYYRVETVLGIGKTYGCGKNVHFTYSLAEGNNNFRYSFLNDIFFHKYHAICLRVTPWGLPWQVEWEVLMKHPSKSSNISLQSSNNNNNNIRILVSLSWTSSWNVLKISQTSVYVTDSMKHWRNVVLDLVSMKLNFYLFLHTYSL